MKTSNKNIKSKNNILLFKLNKKVKIYKFKIVILMILFINFTFFQILNYKNLKVCVCTPAKKENRYIREFIEHYKNYNVDKIFLYDNNDLNGERFEEVINDYIQTGFVDIVDFRGQKRVLLNMMNDCYKKNYHKYDWLIFFEVDEFIYLKDYHNIKEYLNNNRFNKCDKIQLNWLFHTDNNLLYYDNRTLKERFPEIELKARGVKKGPGNAVKSITRGHKPKIEIKDVHNLYNTYKNCDGFGKPAKINGISCEISDFEYYYIDHYNFKSTEEFIDKINKGDVLYYKDNIMDRIRTYFGINKITIEKIEFIEKETKMNLSEFRNILNLQNKLQ